MKRFISFIIGTVFLSIMTIHNPVMALGSSMKMTIGDHMQMESQQEECHEEGIDDCNSICCFDTDFSIINISNTFTQENKKNFSKLKIIFLNIFQDKLLIHEWNLVSDISPPIKHDIYKENFILLTGIIKSNT